MGFGLAVFEHHIYDPQNGLPGTVSLYQAKPPTYLDVAQNFHTDAVDKPDPQSPLGTKGIGEPVMGARRIGVALRDLGCARRPLLQPSARHARSDHQRACRPSAVAQAAASQHGLTQRTLGLGPC